MSINNYNKFSQMQMHLTLGHYVYDINAFMIYRMIYIYIYIYINAILFFFNSRSKYIK